MTPSILLLAAAAHIHGQGALDIAIESDRVDIYLTAPESDLRDPAESGNETLEERFARRGLFTFEGASCRLESSQVEPVTDPADIWREAAQNGQEVENNEDRRESHSEDDHAHHVDYRITWSYLCTKDPEAVDVDLFGVTRLERIRFQALGASGAQTGDLTRDVTAIELP